MDDRAAPFMEHLRELRNCLRNAVIALAVSVVITFGFSEQLFVLLARPLISAIKESGLQAQLKFGSLVEPFWVYFELSLYAGIFLASPFIFHQLWRFIAPGLYQKEKRVALPFSIFSALFFMGGAAFCYSLVLPAAFRFFLSYSSQNVSQMNDVLGFISINLADPLAIEPSLFMQQYLDLTTKMLLAFGLVFEMPLLFFFLSYVGLVTHRSLWKFNKYAAVLSFVVGAILTPGPDVFSQLLMAGPMIVLYNVSILVAWVVTKRREAAERTDATAVAK
ncbi:MAG: twin-arginine translocase subunit TatC [Deltaproteobacteria bacterium]|nr:twin-arginine translocase subunit TatC [Deltaproteobacteria bacterium]